MKILIDTNVLISAFLNGGSCYDVIDHAIHAHEIFYTDFIIKEFKRIFRKNFRFSESLINEFVLFIHKFFIQGQTSPHIENACRDKDDNQVLADALINEINIIITGDKDLLVLKNYKGIQIIKPTDYWNL